MLLTRFSVHQLSKVTWIACRVMIFFTLPMNMLTRWAGVGLLFIFSLVFVFIISKIKKRVFHLQTSVMANYLKVKVKGALDLRNQSLSDLQDKVTSLEGEVAQLREDKAGLERSLKDKENENQAVLQLLRKDYEAACRDKTSLEKELEKMRDAAIAKSTDLSKNLEEKVLELNYLNDEKTKLEGQVRDKEDVIEGLRAQVAKESTASFDLMSRVQFLEDKVESTKAQGLEASTLYCQMLQRFGGLGGGPSDSASIEDLFAWMKSEFAELPDFIGKVGDFGTLSGVTNLLSMMEKFGCGHLQEFLKKSYAFPSPNELGEPSRTVNIARRRFFREFWASHGRDHARSLAEARQAEVCSFRVLPLPFICLFAVQILILFDCVSGEEG